MIDTTSIRIAKDQLQKLEFAQIDQSTYPDRDEQTIKRMLQVAIDKTSKPEKMSKITFLSKRRGIFHINSTILMAGNDFIVLKGGKSVPIASILKINP